MDAIQLLLFAGIFFLIVLAIIVYFVTQPKQTSNQVRHLVPRIEDSVQRATPVHGLLPSPTQHQLSWAAPDLVPNFERFAPEHPQPSAPLPFVTSLAQQMAQRWGQMAVAFPPPKGFDPNLVVPEGYAVESADAATFGAIDAYRARLVAEDKPVLIKYINESLLTPTEGFRLQLERQIAISQTIRHQFCARVYAGSAQGAKPYVVEERVSGGTLTNLLGGGPLAQAQWVRIVGQLCDALAYLHKRNIVFGVLSPEHVLLDEIGNVRLIHCGFASLVAQATQSRRGLVFGNMAYAAPEHVGSRTHTVHGDLYSLGIMAYQLATGQQPFESYNDAVVRVHREIMPPDPSALNPDLTQVARTALLKALQIDPARRFQSARDMARAIGYSAEFDGVYEATHLLYMPPTFTQEAYAVATGGVNPYDFRQKAAAPVAVTGEQLRLRNVQSGSTILVSNLRTVITRELINPADAMISRTNGQIYLKDGIWWVSELPNAESANGIFVNETRVTQPRSIRLGDRVRFGKTTLKVI